MLLQEYMLLFLDQFQVDNLLSFNFLFNAYLFLSAALSVALSCAMFRFLSSYISSPKFHTSQYFFPQPYFIQRTPSSSKKDKLAVSIMSLNKKFVI